LALRPNSGADVGAKEGRRHSTIGAERVAERGVPFSSARHQPVSGAQVEGVAEMITEVPQQDRVVKGCRGEKDTHELKAWIEGEAGKLEEVAVDLPGTDILDRMRGAGAVDKGIRAAREISVAHLRDQVEAKFDRNALRILRANQDEPTAFLVVAANQE